MHIFIPCNALYIVNESCWTWMISIQFLPQVTWTEKVLRLLYIRYPSCSSPALFDTIEVKTLHRPYFQMIKLCSPLRIELSILDSRTQLTICLKIYWVLCSGTFITMKLIRHCQQFPYQSLLCSNLLSMRPTTTR